MGRYYPNAKSTVEESCDLTIFGLRKMGMLVGRASTVIAWVHSRTNKKTNIRLIVDIRGEPYARFNYIAIDGRDQKTDYDYKVNLVTTSCHFGGVRYWFACPLCWRQVGILYLAPGDIRFRCRHCNNLTYRSRNRCRIESFGHTSRQIDKLRSQIKCWTYGSKPTRKARRLQALEDRFARYVSLSRPYLRQ